MSVSMVHPGSSNYGFAGTTIKRKFLSLNIHFLNLNVRI